MLSMCSFQILRRIFLGEALEESEDSIHCTIGKHKLYGGLYTRRFAVRRRVVASGEMVIESPRGVEALWKGEIDFGGTRYWENEMRLSFDRKKEALYVVDDDCKKVMQR